MLLLDSTRECWWKLLPTGMGTGMGAASAVVANTFLSAVRGKVKPATLSSSQALCPDCKDGPRLPLQSWTFFPGDGDGCPSRRPHDLIPLPNSRRTQQSWHYDAFLASSKCSFLTIIVISEFRFRVGGQNGTYSVNRIGLYTVCSLVYTCC